MVIHTFNPNSQVAEVGRRICVSSRPTWSTKQVPGQPEPHYRRDHVSTKDIVKTGHAMTEGDGRVEKEEMAVSVPELPHVEVAHVEVAQ